MGPSLVDQHAHQAIHDAARFEMEAGTELLHTSVSRQDSMTALRLARELADGWHQRVLAHADAEEQDMFPQVVAAFPASEAMVAALIRDHEVMRLLVEEVRQELDRESEVTPAVLGRFTALLHVQRLHSSLEELSFLPRITEGALDARALGEASTLWPDA